MSKPNPQDRLYSRDHEWAKDNGDGTVVVGITDYAQEMLTDIVFVELPSIGKKVAKGEPLAVVESVKSVSDVYSPVSGEVIDVNTRLEETPELVNQDAFGEGWIVKMHLSDAGELKTLLSAADYEQMLKEEKH
ncbi:glycine cleavage system protein H [Smithella sp. SCADC]|jgi:glycine cleavage system H protein|nr:glycine cleavage system protein H [Smithella sp. SCADC]HAR49280.1 glycine cleavage system protein GcvH [Smithella sp.]